MSSKTKTNAIKEEAKPALVPKLRFPEFRGAGEWKSSVLADACDMQAGKFVSASDISERNQAGLFPCYGGNGLRGYTATHTHNGTYPLIGRQGALCGNVRLASGQFHATEHAVVATPKKVIDVGWLCYSLDLLNLNRFATGQAQPGLSVDVLQNVALAIPPLKTEQQKIAECLSSVDELMAAQARKVDALKIHKKGLMQQLFPCEGETQPRLRFPEFQNAGQWESKKLEDISTSVFDGTHQTPTYTSKGVPFYSVENLISGNANKCISREDYLLATKKNKPEKGDVLITRIGKIGHSQVVTWDHEFSIYVTLAVIKQSKDFNSHFLSHFIQSESYQSELRAKSLPNAVPPKINLDSLRSSRVLLTSAEEQILIADSLNSLDDLISAETQKLDALKTLKKGLMQQLFPSAEDNS